jgi:ribosome biogenesis GTPase
MSFQPFSLRQLGWRLEYAQHLTLADFEAGYPARVMAVHRHGLSVLSSRGAASVVLPRHLIDTAVAVGDWVLVEHDAQRVLRLVERRSLIARLAEGSDCKHQVLAANLDTLFIVLSCSGDFSLPRLKRYLMLALDAAVRPVIVLTKSDLSATFDAFVAETASLLPALPVVAVNAMAHDAALLLSPWLESGSTVAFVGASGKGKPTLAHRVMDEAWQRIGNIPEDDARGRHTVKREMFPTESGAWVIDTPGLRALCFSAAEQDRDEAFGDIEVPA